jgi:hypothetical protein
MAISGHKTRSVFERYNIVSANDIREAGEKLDAFHGAKVIHNSFTVVHQDAAADSRIN